MKIHHEVISIHPERKTVSVKNLENGDIFEEKYDKLILSPGAKDVYKRQVKSSTQILCIWLSDMHDYGSLFSS